MIVQQASLTDQVLMLLLSVKLIFVSVIGNGSFLAIFCRFKNLRNFPNILFANLAALDFFNGLFNVPMFVMYFILKTSWLKGKAWTIISSSSHLEFTLLNATSMFALMLDRFFALYFDLKYFTWKTTTKACVIVFLIWLVCTIVVALTSIPLHHMDLDDQPLMVSRSRIFHQRKVLLTPLICLFIAAATALGVYTSYMIFQKKKQASNLKL